MGRPPSMVGGAHAPRHRWRRSIQVARLPSHSQGYCSTHERPGTWTSSPRDQYSSLLSHYPTWTWSPKLCRSLGPEGVGWGPGPPLRANFSTRYPERARRGGGSGPKFSPRPKTTTNNKTEPPQAGLPGAFRGLQGAPPGQASLESARPSLMSTTRLRGLLLSLQALRTFFQRTQMKRYCC